MTLLLQYTSRRFVFILIAYPFQSGDDEDILRFVDNYHLNLIAPAEIADEDFSKFHTELSLALKYVKYSKDKKRLKEMISEDTAFRSVSRKTADMVNVVTKSNLRYNNGEERVDMCEAIGIEGVLSDVDIFMDFLTHITLSFHSFEAL